jgi:hypothetical protein
VGIFYLMRRCIRAPGGDNPLDRAEWNRLKI